MADRPAGRTATRTTGAKTKGRKKPGSSQAGAKSEPQTNREVVFQRLEELTAPILDKYGVPAFDELVTRLEGTVKEFTEEVNTLFDEMVVQAREDHERMKSLLVEGGDEECSEGETEELVNEEGMSELEKRLEKMDKAAKKKSEKK
ncbi:MAG: hypothetical protein JSU61_10500 [Fidelibacterota bacterium]|nr:MAG: hypothetical protein JSU61_10500 [Candidatus Neomarinimicrobiota bacterium]